MVRQIDEGQLLARGAPHLHARGELPILGLPVERQVVRHDVAEPREAAVEHHHTGAVRGQAVQELDASVGACVAIEVEAQAEPGIVDACAPTHTRRG